MCLVTGVSDAAADNQPKSYDICWSATCAANLLVERSMPKWNGVLFLISNEFDTKFQNVLDNQWDGRADCGVPMAQDDVVPSKGTGRY
jgi:hypothetical protein